MIGESICIIDKNVWLWYSWLYWKAVDSIWKCLSSFIFYSFRFQASNVLFQWNYFLCNEWLVLKECTQTMFAGRLNLVTLTDTATAKTVHTHYTICKDVNHAFTYSVWNPLEPTHLLYGHNSRLSVCIGLSETSRIIMRSLEFVGSGNWHIRYITDKEYLEAREGFVSLFNYI